MERRPIEAISSPDPFTYQPSDSSLGHTGSQLLFGGSSSLKTSPADTLTGVPGWLNIGLDCESGGQGSILGRDGQVLPDHHLCRLLIACQAFVRTARAAKIVSCVKHPLSIFLLSPVHVQDGIYALGKAHVRSIPRRLLESSPAFTFENVPLLVFGGRLSSASSFCASLLLR